MTEADPPNAWLASRLTAELPSANYMRSNCAVCFTAGIMIRKQSPAESQHWLETVAPRLAAAGMVSVGGSKVLACSVCGDTGGERDGGR